MLIKTTKKACLRTCDPWGCGYYHASRGDRLHNGVDLLCNVGDDVLCDVDGTLTKIGYPYGDDLYYRYMEIEDSDELNHRFFYVEPNKLLAVGDTVHVGTVLGAAQDLRKRYPDKRNGEYIPYHIHYEIVRYLDAARTKKDYVDPSHFV